MGVMQRKEVIRLHDKCLTCMHSYLFCKDMGIKPVCASVTACKNDIPCVGDMGLNNKLSVSRAFKYL